ncbi:MAG: LuxR family transcriptional regulator [Burkholderia sp.]|nr:LuxR family transcriptional regulator [Burkholderia sp.]
MCASPIRVLLVDDHAVVRDGMRLMLSSAADIEVAGEAETARQALRLSAEQHFDVALVDINLPDKSGLDLLRTFREERPKLRTLMLSMYSEEIYGMRALKHGAAGYLTKSCTAAMAVEAVRKVAAGGKYVSPAMADKLAGMIQGGAVGSHEVLSDRELQVLRLVAVGESLVRIAGNLHLSPSTVTTYRARILEKMGLRCNAELNRYEFVNGLLK